MTTKGRGRAIALAAALFACASSSGAAQRRPAEVEPWTGYELALSGASSVRAGRDARFRGVAYRVRGLATLVPFSGRVRARVGWRIGERPGSPWTVARVAADGRFELELPIPLGASEGDPRVEVEVGPEGEARLFELPVSVVPGVDAMLRTDRELYEPGETAHVWMLVRDAATGRPLSGERVDTLVAGGVLPITRGSITTSDAGVAHFEIAIPAGTPEGHVSLTAVLPGQVSLDHSFRVGTRTWERLFARATVEPEEVAPNAPATVHVVVTTASGAPVRDAGLNLLVDRNLRYGGTTDADGRASITVRAPAYLVHQTGNVSIEVEITHPAHGSVRTFAAMRLAVPLALALELFARQGGLIPEIDDVLFVQLRDGAGHPPSAATEVTVEGPAVRGGRATALTDSNGLAEIPTRVPLGAASSHRGQPETSVLVTVAGPLERVARMPIPVLRDAEVGLVADRVVAEPGAPIEVRLSRRPSVERLPILVELVDDRGEPLVVRLAPPRTSIVRFDLPPGRLGLFSIRARAVHADRTLEGTGSLARLIVRPADPDFVRLEPERPRWTVSETARVTLRTGAGGPRRFAALLVRDLAAHGGEHAFGREFLEGRFDRALLDPHGEDADRLVRAALAAHLEADPRAPEVRPLVDALGLPSEGGAEESPRGRNTLRDPWPLARELEQRGVEEPMRAIEARLREALEQGSLDEITTGVGASRRFRDDLLAGDDEPTLGGAPITPAILETADPSFRFETVARRVARARLVGLMSALAAYLDPGDDAPPAARMAAREPWARWLPRMVERGLLDANALDDPWGHRFALHETRSPLVVLSASSTGLELVSPGPDGRIGTQDDVRDPFARVVPAGTPYAIASGEDRLMRSLAVLSPLERTLEAIRESYRRISAEMTEEAIGDAVSAEVSEGTLGLGNIGTIGHGGGSGSGSGYGRGAGGMRGRTSRSPQIRMGHAMVSGLAAVVRERFPPTLLFRPTLVVDPSGTTEISISLADAVTTYLVEVIVWREDGWISSASTRFEVDREVVASAPIPSLAHVGDRVRLPLRVANRTDAARSLTVRLLGDRTLGIPDSEPHAIEVGPSDAVVVPLEVSPAHVGEGHLSVAVTDPEGHALDAVRLPMRVIAPSRRVLAERDALAEGETTIVLDVPRGADPREGSVTLSVGSALFPPDADDSPWALWAPGGGAPVDPDVARGWLQETRTTRRGFAVGAAWASDAFTDAELDRSVTQLSLLVDRVQRRAGEEPRQVVQALAWTLLGLAPAAQTPGRRPSATRLGDLVTRLRSEVASGAVALSDDPESWIVAAAALGWSARPSDRERVAELIRRAERHQVDIGNDRWLATEERAVRSTLLWAMAELSLGRRERAFALLATVGRWSSVGHALSTDERGLARAAIHRLMDGEEPRVAEVWIDGEHRRVDLDGGAATIDAMSLAQAGHHEVRVRADGGALLFARASARYGVPWSVAPRERGPFDLRIEGAVGGHDRVSELVLVVRNRLPRLLSRPVVEIELPTGAELTESDRGRMGAPVVRGGGVLTVSLPPLGPGAERRVPLPLRWTVPGTLEGLGVAAYAEDRREAVSILPPRSLAIVEVEQ